MMTARDQTSTFWIDVLTSFDQADDLASDWNRLAYGNPFRSCEWYRAWWNNYGQAGDLRLHVLRNENQVAGIFPLFIEHRQPLGRVLRLLGSGDVCSDQQGILYDLSLTEPQRIGTVLAASLAREEGHSATEGRTRSAAITNFDLMELEGLAKDCPVMMAFRDELQQRQFVTHERSTPNTWRIVLPSSLEEYLASLSKPSRRKIRTAWKQFDSQQINAEFVSTSKQFEQVWAIFVALHQQRRKSLGEAGCFASQSFTHFLRDVSLDYLRSGRLEFVYVSKGGIPIATELCFRGDGVTFAYQIGINPDTLRDNPGWLANAAAIRRTIEQGQSAFDLCRGDDEYKRHLGAEPTSAEAWRLVPPRFRSQLWDAALITQSTIKDWLKSGLTMTGIR